MFAGEEVLRNRFLFKTQTNKKQRNMRPFIVANVLVQEV